MEGEAKGFRNWFPLARLSVIVKSEGDGVSLLVVPKQRLTRSEPGHHRDFVKAEIDPIDERILCEGNVTEIGRVSVHVDDSLNAMPTVEAKVVLSRAHQDASPSLAQNICTVVGAIAKERVANAQVSGHEYLT